MQNLKNYCRGVTKTMLCSQNHCNYAQNIFANLLPQFLVWRKNLQWDMQGLIGHLILVSWWFLHCHCLLHNPAGKSYHEPKHLEIRRHILGGCKGGGVNKRLYCVPNSKCDLISFPLHLTINCGLPWKFNYTKSLRLKVKIADNLQYWRIPLQVEIIIRHNWEINEPQTWQSTMLLGYDLLKLKQNSLLFDKKQTPLSSVVQFYLPCLNLANSKLPRSSLENNKVVCNQRWKKGGHDSPLSGMLADEETHHNFQA